MPPQPLIRRPALTGIGGVTAALLGSLCCLGPLLFVTLGVGLGFASALEPYRPLFGMVMLVSFAAGFWSVYGSRLGAGWMPRAGSIVSSDGADSCDVGAACPAPMRRARDVVILWSAAAVALVLWTFPTWSLWLL